MLAPVDRQFQKPDSVPCRGGIEDDDIIRDFILGLFHHHEVDKPVEGRDFRCAGRIELLFHNLHDAHRHDRAHGSENAFAILLGGLVGIYFHTPEVFDAQWGDFVADSGFKDIGKVRGGVGGDDEGLFAALRIVDCSGACHRGFANAALTGEKDILCFHALAPWVIGAGSDAHCFNSS